MNALPEFSFAHPRNVETAVRLRREYGDSRFLAGGTDLIVNLRRGIAGSALLIDLNGIDELKTIALTATGVRIGAGVTLAALAAEPLIAARYAAAAQAAGEIAGPSHRTAATVGGNLCLDTRCIYYNQSEWWRKANGYCLKLGGDVCHVAPQGERCHAAFSGDLAPALIVLGAEVEIAGPAGRRRIALEDLYEEDGRAHLKLAADELVVAVHLPADAPPSAYRKVRTRGSIDFPLAGVAVSLALNGDRIAALRVALTGTNARPFLLEGTQALVGGALDQAALTRLEKLVQKQVQPMRTTIASANYRRLAAAAIARRLAQHLASNNGKAA